MASIVDPQIKAQVDQDFWAVIGVGSTVDDPSPGSPWAYTIGLHPRLPYELMIRGFGFESMTMILNTIGMHAMELHEKGEELEVGKIYVGDPFGGGVRWQLVLQGSAVDVTNWTQATEWHKEVNPDTGWLHLQVLVADKNNKLPHELPEGTEWRTLQEPW